MASNKKRKDRNGYFRLLKLSLRHPKLYSELIPLEGGFKKPILFFLINFVIGSFVIALINTAVSRNVSLFFLGISSTIFSIPFALIILFLISGALHLVAKLLSGKGSFQSSLQATAYSFIYLIFLWIPFVGLIFYFLMLYVLTLSFVRAHQYSIIKASVNIALPFIISIVLSFVLGLLNTNRFSIG